MADNPITVSLPADLPTNWTYGQTVAPSGSEAGLSEQYGYNYLMTQVNAAQQAAAQLGAAFPSLASLDESGKVPANELPDMDYDPAGSAEGVQNNLNTHTANHSNPHQVTAAQVGAYSTSDTLQASTAALYGLGADAVPDDVLSILSAAALYKLGAATAQIGALDVGTTIYLNENGSPVPYIIVHQGIPSSALYDAVCNGTWVLRRDIYEMAPWDEGNSNVLPGADIFTTMSNLLPMYDDDVQSAIKSAIIPYCVGGGSSTIRDMSDGITCKIFPLSGYEVGFTGLGSLPIDGAKLDYFDSGIGTTANSKRISTFNGSNSGWWLRSPYTSVSDGVWAVSNNGSAGYMDGITGNLGIRPAFILPTTFTSYFTFSVNGIYDVFGNLIFSLPGAQIETGTYTGTGTYGSGNPNSLTFSFEPKFVSIVGQNPPYYRAIFPYGGYGLIWISSSTNAPLESYGLAATWEDNTLSWYSSYNIVYQLNMSGTTYQYVAFG